MTGNWKAYRIQSQFCPQSTASVGISLWTHQQTLCIDYITKSYSNNNSAGTKWFILGYKFPLKTAAAVTSDSIKMKKKKKKEMLQWNLHW